MIINLFEGFKRFNQIIMAMIFVVGFCIVFNESVSIHKTIHHKGKDYRAMGDELFGDKPQQKSEGKHVASVNGCVDSYQSTKYLDEGSVYFTFCFDQNYEYESMRDFADNYQITEAERADLNKQLHQKWLQSLMQNIVYVFLMALGYFVFCKVVKYIAAGFIKQ